MKSTALSCVAGVLAISNVLATELIINGSFEDPDVAFNTYEIFDSIPGWIGLGDGIEIQDHTYPGSGTPFVGEQYAELDSWNNSGMYQTVPTTPGSSYAFSFAYSPRPSVMADSNLIHVYFDGTLLASLTGDGGTDSIWTVYRYAVTASGSFATVLFEADGVSDTLGGYIDNVSFSPLGVPDAASSSLLLGCSFMLLSILRLKLKN